MMPFFGQDRGFLIGAGSVRCSFSRTQASGAISTADNGLLLSVDVVGPGVLTGTFARTQASGDVSTGDV